MQRLLPQGAFLGVLLLLLSGGGVILVYFALMLLFPYAPLESGVRPLRWLPAKSCS